MAKVFTISEGLENMGALKTGGQGSVYKGRRIGEIFTAIKILPTPIYSESAADKNFISFQNEVFKLKKVNEKANPNVVKIISSGITDSGNFPFIEMEYIEGPDLEDLLKPPHDPIFSIKEITRIAEQLSNALAHCHKVDVKHGDIKSNNVKYNSQTGNYILLDFGLSIMSDEQRRTSLRHAGAIEFMAPEQNEGLMFFETDIYSFGVILFELVSGTVPFPLKDKGETSRNHVMVSHMEASPPDMLSLRNKALPASWSEIKRAQEMGMPEWIILMILKCLEKETADRFKNGMALHEYILNNNILSGNNMAAAEQLKFLQKENQRLVQEKEQLRLQLSAITETSSKLIRPYGVVMPAEEGYTASPIKRRGGFFKRNVLLILALIGTLVLLTYAFILNRGHKAAFAISDSLLNKRVLAEYKVQSLKSYLYSEPDENLRTSQFVTRSNRLIPSYNEKNGFIYTEFLQDSTTLVKGWMRKKDLVSPNNGLKSESLPAANPIDMSLVDAQLNEARGDMDNDAVAEALTIYRDLVKIQIPEAMYEYGALALQNKNPQIDCARGFGLILKAAQKGFGPAQRTAGLLYSFADKPEMLHQFNFDRCIFNKNLDKGSKLLMQAMLQGDSTASLLLDELNSRAPEATPLENNQ